MKRPYFVTLGPPVPIVPVGDFSRMALTEQQWADAWRLCGPSAAMNMAGGWRRRPLELWQVIASAYLEGLGHGAAIEREGVSPSAPPPVVLTGYLGGEGDAE